MQWKISEIYGDGELITHVRYHASVTDEHTVETEGHRYFNEPQLKIPFADVTEEMLISWVIAEATKDGVNTIEARLREQLKALSGEKKMVAPWMPQIITVSV